MATSGFSSRAWDNTDTGMITSTDAVLEAPWKRMSSFQPRNGVTVAVEALNFIVNGLDVGDNALIDGPAVKTSVKRDAAKNDTRLHQYEDIEWQLSNLEDIVLYILNDLNPRAASSLQKTAKYLSARAYNTFRGCSATAASIGLYCLQCFTGQNAEPEISTMRIEGSRSNFTRLQRINRTT